MNRELRLFVSCAAGGLLWGAGCSGLRTGSAEDANDDPTAADAGSGGSSTGGADAAWGGAAAGSGGAAATASTLVLEEQASGFCSVDGVVETKNSGFGGTGYANTDNAVGSGIAWQLSSPSGGPVELHFRYASIADRSARILVNGAEVAQLAFPSTGAWTSWSTTTSTVTLSSGSTAIRLEATSEGGLPNIDSLTVLGPELAVADCGEGPAVDPDKAVSIYLIGDSTVMDYSVRNDYLTNYFPQAGWGEMLQDLLTPSVMSDIGHVVAAGQATVVNWAMGGRSSRSFWEEGRWQQVQDLLEPDDYVFIQFGHNDEASCSDYPDRCTPIPQFQDFLRQYIDTTLAKGAFPVLITPLNRDYPWSGGKLTNSHGQYPAAMLAVAKEKHVPVIDVSRRSLELFNAKGEATTTNDYFMVFDAGDYPQFKVTSTYPNGSPSNDRTHLQQGGATAIAQLVVAGLVDLVDIEVVVEPASCGTVSGAGWYEKKFTSSTTLQALAKSGCTFESWSGDAVGTSASLSVATTQSKKITAHFAMP